MTPIPRRLPRRAGRIIGPAALLGLAVLSACAQAAPQPVVAAIESNDLAALEALAESAPTAPQRNLAAGAALALRHRDLSAAARLRRVIHSRARRTLRFIASVTLAQLYVRDQRYRACYTAYHTALQLSPRSFGLSKQQGMAVCRALTVAKPMRVVRETPGSLPITRDRAGLMRIAVRLGGHDHEAILDTGANLSTISASAAKQAGIHLLPQALSVGSASQRALPMRLGIAPWVQLGTARLTNVVFIVLPDAALRFPHGYRINVIIGLPVLMALGQRLEIVNSGMPELLYDVPRATPADASTAPAQMLLCGPTLLLLVRLPGIRTPLPMTLDTGSDSTAFSHHALAAAPTAFAHARRHITHFGGAGGETAASGRLVPAATFIIGRHRFELKNVPLGSPAHASGYWKSDGNIGQNVLSQAARWTMNFKTMTLAVGN